jgi:hypothetical protein
MILVSKSGFWTSKCLFEAAEILFEQNNPEFAISCLEEAANKDPTIVSSVDLAILRAKATQNAKGSLPFIVPLFKTENPPFLWFIAFTDLCIESDRLDTALVFLKRAAAIMRHLPSAHCFSAGRQSCLHCRAMSRGRSPHWRS